MKLFGFLLIFVLHHVISQSTYQVGIGIADVTGPAAEINMVRMVFRTEGFMHLKIPEIDS